MLCILVGYGEVGSSLYKVFSPAHHIEIHDPKKNKYALNTKYDLMLVAIPYKPGFVQVIKSSQEFFEPKATIVFSSTAIGVCKKLKAIHSPVEGIHPTLAESIMHSPRWIGGMDGFKKVKDFLLLSGFDENSIVHVKDSRWTEFLKLRSTSLYGLNIEFARYTKKVADKIGMDYTWSNLYDSWYNKLYRLHGKEEYKRYVLYPPKGNIGGHCVIPNAEILNRQHPHDFLKEIFRDKGSDKDGYKF